MKVAAAASPAMGPGSDTPATAAVTPGSSADRRPGSSRVRRPPKRLLSPPPQPRQQRQHSSLSSSPAPPLPSSSSTMATSATLPSSPSSSMQTSANAVAAQTSDKASQLPRSSSSSSRPEMNPGRVSSPSVTAKIDGKNTNTSSRKASSATNNTATPGAGPSSTESSDCLAADAANASQDDLTTGPGKRKRKPSTLGRPPSTITIAPPPPATVGSGSSGSCSKRESGVSTSSQKSRTSPSISGASSSEPGKFRIKVRHSAGSSSLKRPNLPSVSENTVGYDSDGGQAAPLRGEGLHYYMEAKLRAARDDGMEVDEEGDLDDVDHLAAPPLFYQRSRSGHAAIGKASPEMRRNASATAAANSRKRAAQTRAPSGVSTATNSLQQGQSTHQLHKSQRQIGHHRTKSMPSISSQVLPSIFRCQRSSLDTADLGDVSGAETTDAEDEDDFHREMMEADFDAFDSADSWMGKSGEVDTPATTPRSPQSTCEPLSDHHEAASSGKASVRSSSDPEAPAAAPAMADTLSSESNGSNGSKTNSSSKTEDGKAVKKEVDSKPAEASRDAVFAHALPPSSRRTQTHAGLLTLSLPYDETKVYTSPIGKQGMTTPILKRSSNGHGSGVRVVRIKEEDEEEESASHQLLRLLHDSAQARLEERSKAHDHDGTTSPPLSPTQALLKAGPSRDNHLNLPGTASLTSSPFLSAVHHQVSSVSRPGTPPAGFNLPPSIVAREESPAVSPASTRQDLRDVSPFPSGAEDEVDAVEGPSRRNDSSPLHAEEGEEGNDSPSHLSAFSPEATDADLRDPLFSLPETMDLDDIDVAYGGKGRAALLSSSQARHAAMVSSGQSISLRVEGLVAREDVGGLQQEEEKAELTQLPSAIADEKAATGVEDKTSGLPAAKGRRRGVKRPSDVFDEKADAAEDKEEEAAPLSSANTTPARKSRKGPGGDTASAAKEQTSPATVKDGDAKVAQTDSKTTTPAKKKSSRASGGVAAAATQMTPSGRKTAPSKATSEEKSAAVVAAQDAEDLDAAEREEVEKQQMLLTPTPAAATRRGAKSPGSLSASAKKQVENKTVVELVEKKEETGKAAVALKRTRSRKGGK